MAGIYFEYPGDDASQEEKDQWVERELTFLSLILECLEAGTMVRRAGLIYSVPSCHDWGVEA